MSLVGLLFEKTKFLFALFICITKPRTPKQPPYLANHAYLQWNYSSSPIRKYKRGFCSMKCLDWIFSFSNSLRTACKPRHGKWKQPFTKQVCGPPASEQPGCLTGAGLNLTPTARTDSGETGPACFVSTCEKFEPEILSELKWPQITQCGLKSFRQSPLREECVYSHTRPSYKRGWRSTWPEGWGHPFSPHWKGWRRKRMSQKGPWEWSCPRSQLGSVLSPSSVQSQSQSRQRSGANRGQGTVWSVQSCLSYLLGCSDFTGGTHYWMNEWVREWVNEYRMREGTSNANWICEAIIIANTQILSSILNSNLLSFSCHLLQNSLTECGNAIKPQNTRMETPNRMAGSQIQVSGCLLGFPC